MRSFRPGRSLYVLVTTLGLGYPFLVYVGLRAALPLAVLPALILFVAARFVLARREGMPRALADASWLAGAGALAVALLSPATGLKAYPVFLSLIVATLFGYSLLRPPTIIERIARLIDPHLPSAALPYLRRLTMVWIGFLLANAAISAATALSGNLPLWTLYNGVISYCLMGALFAGELVVRRLVLRASGAT